MRKFQFTKLSDSQAAQYPAVETWWDSQSRNYVTQRKDATGTQVGDSLFAGVPGTAKANHESLVTDMRAKPVDTHGYSGRGAVRIG